MKETPAKAGLEYVRKVAKGLHIFRDVSNGNLEVWAANKNHASYGLRFKNTHLEFVSSAHAGPLLAASV